MANKKYMKCYNAYKPSKYIAYLDANNLHGQAMSQYLPYSEFKWLNQKEIVKFDVSLIGEKCSNRYIYQNLILNILMNYINCIIIILQLQKNLKLIMICYQIIVAVLQINMTYKIGIVNKLVPNLSNKSKYVLYYRSLQLYL